VTRDEQGLAAVEALLIAPVLLILVALLVGGGQITSDQAALRAVAREVGRISVTAPTSSEAIGLGRARVTEVGTGYGLEPSRLHVSIDPGSFERGGEVRVHATYTVNLSNLPALGLLPGSSQLTASHTEPIDRYNSR
jgi:Flp pilus assembly protein TadG